MQKILPTQCCPLPGQQGAANQCAINTPHISTSSFSLQRIPQSHLPLKLTSRNIVRIKVQVCFPSFSYPAALVLVCYSCYDKMPETECLEQQEGMFSLFWRFMVQDQGVCRFGFSSDLASWLAEGCLLSASAWLSLRFRGACVHTSSCDTSQIGWGPIIWLGFTLITSLRALSLNIVTVWGTEVWNCNIWTLREHN